MPIEFPASDLSTDQKKLARWYNFFDPDDVLGYLLKPLSSGYDKVVNAGIPINVGRLLSSWNPASHTQYWTDDSFTKPVVKFLMEFLQGKPCSRAGLVIEVIRRCAKQRWAYSVQITGTYVGVSPSGRAAATRLIMQLKTGAGLVS